MQVSLVTETYPPEVNGVAMTLSQLVDGLQAHGHSVQVVRPLQKGEPGPLRSASSLVTVSGFPIPGYPELRFGLFCVDRLKRAWQSQTPSIVHVATEGPLGLSAIRAARSLDIPCVSTFHTNFHSYAKHYRAPFAKRLVLAYLRWIHNATRCTMAPTTELSEALAEEGFLNMDVFGRGVRLDYFSPEARNNSLREEWGADRDSLVVVHVSRLAAEKNYETLFATYALIAERQPDARFVIVGDGPARKKWQSRFPQGIFLGMVRLEERARLGQIYASSDLFLYPSETETYGNVLTEAMASGLPAVAYNYAAAAQHVENGINGLTVPLGDVQAFQTASLELAGDSARRKAIGQAAARYARPALDWEPVLRRYESILRSLACPRPKRATVPASSNNQG